LTRARVALATRNPGKIKEIRSILSDVPIEIVLPDERWVSPPEHGTTYRENAVEKAGSLAKHLGVPAMADDSGIEVDALDGAPGPRSARYAGAHAGDRENLEALIDALRDVRAPKRTARYRCVAALVNTSGKVVTAEGTVEGVLLAQPRGSGGFGYDPIFVPEGETRTMAELAADEKDRISHRGRAFRALRPAIESIAR
jgi:XTP/dITP diphosphohydrolase